MPVTVLVGLTVPGSRSPPCRGPGGGRAFCGSPRVSTPPGRGWPYSMLCPGPSPLSAPSPCLCSPSGPGHQCHHLSSSVPPLQSPPGCPSAGLEFGVLLVPPGSGPWGSEPRASHLPLASLKTGLISRTPAPNARVIGEQGTAKFPAVLNEQTRTRGARTGSPREMMCICKA